MLPSHQENFGIAVAEALAAGTPALISNKVNIWREIEGDGAGIAADDTLEGTCTLLQSYLEMPEGAEVARCAGLRTSASSRRFEIKQAAQKLNAVLANVSRE